MSKQILVNASSFETRVATLENGEIRQLHIEREEDKNVVGNVYKGVVKRVLPGMQAAFLELGLERTAFLYVDDIIEEPLGSDVELFEEEEGDYQGDNPPDEFDDEDDAQSADAPTSGPITIPSFQADPEAKVPVVEEDDDEAPDENAEDIPALEAGAQEETSEEEAEDEEAEPEEPRAEGQAEERPQGDREGAPRPQGQGRQDGYRDNRPQQRTDQQRPDQRRDNRGGGGRNDNRDARGGGRGGGGGGGRDNRGGYGRGRMPRGGRRRPHHNRRQRPSARIEDLLTEGQELLVQVAKAPIGTKGARLTTHISLPGRNLVLMPTVKHVGISRKIESDRERRRLRDLFMRRIRPREVGFIIRTVAEKKSFRDLRADADYLMKTWSRIKRDSQKKRAPALIHEDLSLSMRAVRDFFTDDIDAFIIDNETEFENVSDFIEQFMPRLKSRVKLFRGPSQLFEHYGIEAEISRALGKKVWLKSGGYLLIDQSEALTSVDVNTGRYVGSKSLEETILKTNLEAVKEIAYQLRIRNVGGIIIIDLIDMESHQNREKVYGALQDALQEDKSKTNILKISELGLVEMTRKRTHEDLVRYLTEACPTCDGRGYTKSKRTVCFEIFREIEKEAINNNKNIVVFAHPDVVDKIMKDEKKHLTYLCDRFSKTVAVKPDPLFHYEQYEVFGKN